MKKLSQVELVPARLPLKYIMVISFSQPDTPFYKRA